MHLSDTPLHSGYRRIDLNIPNRINKKTIILDKGPKIFNGYYFSEEIESAAYKYDIEPELITAIITAESNFNPNATSPTGAMGLMQLMPKTALTYMVENPYNPQQNLEGGIRYLRTLLRMFNGDLRLAIAAYNAGENSVKRYNGIPPFPETEGFVKKVISIYDTLMKKEKKVYRFISSDGIITFTDYPYN
ncbi:MAG: lytic transglycosylase domain-containing protein [Nitrospinae bacterium]|nr:lytic transglycosylase domain-containing protein [Nitrospinota bacterium]